ncbi:Arf family guanine nucleotide exchange factor YEL1 Ecym_4691 [Eremothecium cymbalariae DBVPG|uniref:Guanine-nucleotide exchange factor YEL1 n=1 Tax=Eremothecium cymbalariae (strain CBS 270.75 / DBVPG 7215 / KCTC 17166 / NRRL Y-17582) TaxID=931890 RepID=G8JSJ0_ERECY|nr:hypothetical protein Ecym_4691 [Eremothecium cymbalariae DBVPG\
MVYVNMEEGNNSRLYCISDDSSISLHSNCSKGSTIFVREPSDDAHTDPSPAETSFERMSETDKRRGQSSLLIGNGEVFLDSSFVMESPKQLDVFTCDSLDEGGVSSSFATPTPHLQQQEMCEQTDDDVLSKSRKRSDTQRSNRSRSTAKQILKGTFQGTHYKEYANFLGNPENRAILQEFIALLQPLPVSLLFSLRKLSRSLYFIAEAGAIDAMLEEVSIQWVQRHKTSHYQGNFKLVHIILFSLLILNSDLYNDMAHEKFSSTQFVDNTVYALLKEAPTIDKQKFENELRVYYDILSMNQLPLYKAAPASNPKLPVPNSRKGSRFNPRSNRLERTFSNSSNYSMSTVSLQRTPNSKQSSAGLTNWKYHHDKELPTLYLKEQLDEEMNQKPNTSWLMDHAIQFQEPVEPSPPKDMPPALSLSPNVQPKRRLFGWLKKDHSDSIFKAHHDLSAERKWLNARVRISEGRLYIFNFKHHKALDPRVADLDLCRKRSLSYSVQNLYGAQATFIQDNIVYNSDHKTWNFKIAFPKSIDCDNERIYQFQTTDMTVAQQFVQCATFWSARITPIPSAQFEMVSNQEYGWSDKLLNNEHSPLDVTLSVWTPFIGIDSIYEDIDDFGSLSLKMQLYNLKVFTDQLSELIDKHNACKPKMVSTWLHTGTTKMFEMAMDNWNRRYLYLNKMFEKHNMYLTSLKTACESVQLTTL